MLNFVFALPQSTPMPMMNATRRSRLWCSRVGAEDLDQAAQRGIRARAHVDRLGRRHSDGVDANHGPTAGVVARPLSAAW